MTILEKTATATELKGVQAGVPEAWPSTHDSLKFLWKLDWSMNPVQPTGKSPVQIVSHILDPEAMEVLKAAAEQQRINETAAKNTGPKKGPDAPVGQGFQGMTSATTQ